MKEQSRKTSPCECLDFIEISHRQHVYPLIYCHLEVTGHLNIDRLRRAVSLSSRIVPEIFYAFNYHKNVFVDLNYTVDNVIKCSREFSPSPMKYNLENSPQLQILITRKEPQDYIVFVMSHILTDGKGFLQYLYLLASLYNRERINMDIENVRNLSFLLRNIHISAATEQTRYHRHLTACTLRAKTSERQNFCHTLQITPAEMSIVHQKARQLHVTLNDVFMTAYARVIALVKNMNVIVLPCPADLREFHPVSNFLTIANMSGIYQRVTIEIPAGCSFTDVLQQVHIEMELQKSRYRCFSGIKILHTAFRRIPHNILEHIIKKICHLSPISYTNFGIIDHRKLFFEGCTVRNCFLTGTYRLPPDYQLTISTFKNCCTLNCTLTGNTDDSKYGQYILDMVKEEIIKWAADK